MEVALDNEMTGQELIVELIAADFLQSSAEGYRLAHSKGGRLFLEDGLSLLQNEVSNSDTLRVIPAYPSS